MNDQSYIKGRVNVELFDKDGTLKHSETVDNLVTLIGNQYYGERASGIGSPPAQVSGMRLGTGSTAAAATGAGAAIVTYITGSSIAIDGGFPTSANPSAGVRRITWQTTWPAGTATNSAITEVVITNEASLTNVAGTAANTVSRAVITAVNKTASDTLVISWTHDIGS